MYFKHISSMNIIESTFLSGDQLLWDASSWDRSTSISQQTYYHYNPDTLITSDIFEPINGYLKILPIDRILQLETIYKQIYLELDNEVFTILELDKKLYTLVLNLLQLIDWEHLREWCLSSGNLNTDIGVKDILADNDAIETTYFTIDYENILVFSVLLKLVICIWGQYYLITKDLIGKDQALLHCIEFIKNPIILNNLAYIKLQNYVSNQTNNIIKKKNVDKGFSLLNDIGGDEIDEYMLALVLWKKIITFDGKVINRSIIGNVFQIIKDKLERLSKYIPKQKRISAKNGEEISCDDLYKIAQKLPPATEVKINHYIEKHLAEYLQVDNDRVEGILIKLDYKLEILDFHIAITNILVNNILGTRSLLLANYKSLVRVIVITSLKFEELGFISLAELLLLVPKEKEIHSISFTNVSIEQLPIPVTTLNELAEIYSHVAVVNPALLQITKIIKFINQYQWEFVNGSINKVSQELASLIILMLK